VRVDKGVYGDILWPRARERSVDEALARVADAFHVHGDRLRTHGRRAGMAKKIALELCCEFCGQSQREIGRHFEYTGNGSVGKQRAALRELLKDDKESQSCLDLLRKELAGP
jgi:chromosomal replication initiation ATPase DnaA